MTRNGNLRTAWAAMAVLIAWSPGPSADAQVLHVIVACDVTSPNLAHSMRENQRVIGSLFSGEPRASRVDLVPARGGQLDRDGIKRSIQGLRGAIRANDAVLFFFSGRGFYNTYQHPDGRPWGTCLSFNSGPFLSLREIRDDLKQLVPQPFRTVMIIDCCDPVIGPDRDPPPTASDELVADPVLVRNLFFGSGEKSRFLILNSSRIGQYGFAPRSPGDAPSLFVEAFSNALSRPRNPSADWDHFVNSLQERLDPLLARVVKGGGVFLDNSRWIRQERQDVQLFTYKNP